MRSILAMAAKDVRLLLRDRTGFVVTFVFPLVYAVFFGIIFKNTNVYIPAADEGGPPVLPDNRYAAAFPLGIMWGVLGCSATFGLSLVVERTRGTLLRLRTAPINRAQILAGKALACLLTAFTLGIMLFLLAYFLFDVRPRSINALLVTLASISVAFVGLMMFLSVFGTTEQSASGITWTVLLAVAMLGGGMVPWFLMPGWLQQIAHISPVRWSLLAMDGAVWKNFTAAQLAGPCAILIGIGVILFACGAWVFRWTHRQL